MYTHHAPSRVRPEYLLPTLLERVTQREWDVLRLILEANSSKEIARMLAITPRTVDAHTESLKAKLLARSTTDLLRIVHAAERLGTVTHDLFEVEQGLTAPH